MNDELPTHAICILEVGITKGSKTSGAVLLSPFKCRILYKDGGYKANIDEFKRMVSNAQDIKALFKSIGKRAYGEAFGK